jgi:hypothetical protein
MVMANPELMLSADLQDSLPNDLLAKLRKRLDHRWREVTEESAIDPAVALERGYYLEKRKARLTDLSIGL